MNNGNETAETVPGTNAILAVIDCSAVDAATCIGSLEKLAGQLGATVRTEQISANCTALLLTLATGDVQRLESALLIGGATVLFGSDSPGDLPRADVTVLVTRSANAT